MLSLNGVSKHSGNWNQELIYKALMNVLSRMKELGLNKIQLIHFVPFYVETRPDFSKSFRNMNDDEDSENSEFLFDFVNFINNYLPKDQTGKLAIRVTMVYSSSPMVIKDEWVSSVSYCLDKVNENIEDLREDGVHSVYLVSEDDYNKLDFKAHVDERNCIVY